MRNAGRRRGARGRSAISPGGGGFALAEGEEWSPNHEEVGVGPTPPPRRCKRNLPRKQSRSHIRSQYLFREVSKSSREGCCVRFPVSLLEVQAWP